MIVESIKDCNYSPRRFYDVSQPANGRAPDDIYDEVSYVPVLFAKTDNSPFLKHFLKYYQASVLFFKLFLSLHQLKEIHNSSHSLEQDLQTIDLTIQPVPFWWNYELC